MCHTSWGDFLVFGTAWVNGAGVASIWHSEGAEIGVIAITKCVLIFKTFTHATLPASGYFNPRITHIRLFFIRQLDLQPDCFTRQLIQRVGRKWMASGQIPISVCPLAVQDLYDVALWADSAKQPLAVSVKFTLPETVNVPLLLSLSSGRTAILAKSVPKLVVPFACFP